MTYRTIVPETWDIPSQIRDRFGDSAGRQRAMYAEGHLLLVLHEAPEADDLERKARIMWRNPAGVWAWDKDGSEVNLLKRHVSVFSEKVEALETELQNSAGAADYFRLLQAVAPLHRTSRNLHSTLQQARDLVPGDRDLIVARDVAGDIERAFELLHMDAKNGLDYTVARQTEEQAERSYEMTNSAHRLNVMAAIFLPITALTSIFGMNAPGPQLFSHFFWAIVVGGILAGVLLAQSIVRKPNLPLPGSALPQRNDGAKKPVRNAVYKRSYASR